MNSIGWSVPSLTRVWNLPPPAFSIAFLLSNIGAMVGALFAGPIGDGIGRRPLLLASPEWTPSWHYAAGIVFIAIIALGAMPYAILLLAIFLAGMTTIGNATCGKLYPARTRTSGLGWALGAIAAAPLGGYLLSLGAPSLDLRDRSVANQEIEGGRPEWRSPCCRRRRGRWRTSGSGACKSALRRSAP